MNAMQLSENLKSYLLLQIDNMSQNTPIIGFIKPLITRALDKNFSRVTKAIELISDKDGNVDIENIMSEMIDNVASTKPFTFNTSFIGDVEFGEGQIKLNLPFTSKRLVLDTTDLEAFKEMITNKN